MSFSSEGYLLILQYSFSLRTPKSFLGVHENLQHVNEVGVISENWEKWENIWPDFYSPANLIKCGIDCL